MPHVQNEIVIASSLAQVFSFMVEPQHTAKWMSAIFDVGLLTPGPLTAGSTLWYTFKLNGRRLRTEAIITEYDPPTRCVFATTEGPMTAQSVIRCTVVPDGVVAQFTLDFQRGIFFGFPAGVVEAMIARMVSYDLATLKTLLELPLPLLTQVIGTQAAEQ